MKWVDSVGTMPHPETVLKYRTPTKLHRTTSSVSRGLCQSLWCVCVWVYPSVWFSVCQWESEQRVDESLFLCRCAHAWYRSSSFLRTPGRKGLPPLAKKDIFYSRSIMSVDHYQSMRSGIAQVDDDDDDEDEDDDEIDDRRDTVSTYLPSYNWSAQYGNHYTTLPSLQFVSTFFIHSWNPLWHSSNETGCVHFVGIWVYFQTIDVMVCDGGKCPTFYVQLLDVQILSVQGRNCQNENVQQMSNFLTWKLILKPTSVCLSLTITY